MTKAEQEDLNTTVQACGGPAPAAFADPNALGQWYYDRPGRNDLSIDVETVWQEYTGTGITVGVMDSQIDYRVADLDDNYNHAMDYDLAAGSGDLTLAPGDRPNPHGTRVAGVIAAENANGVGGVGIAYDADVTSFALDYEASNTSQQARLGLTLGKTVDVLNCSWSYTSAFKDRVTEKSEDYKALQTAIEEGRGGLGTVVVFSAGNNGLTQSSNYHGFQNSPYTISVAAVDEEGQAAVFSSLGANVLISGPGVGVLTTNTTSQVYSVDGTSFSAPAVSAMAALMLQANENLGYRDVQEIMALSARIEGLGTEARGGQGWIVNAAAGANGGGMHFSDSYGYGFMNVHDAVRLAETWDQQQTLDDLVRETYSQTLSGQVLEAGRTDHLQVAVEVTGGVEVEHVQLQLQLQWAHSNNIEIFLTSPAGTVSQLSYDFAAQTGGGGFSNFPFSTVAMMGENAQGTWMVDIYNRNPDSVHNSTGAPMTGELRSVALTVHGSAETEDDLYVYTDEFHFVAQADAERKILADTNGGTDTLNAAALTSDARIDLSGQTASLIDGVALEIAGSTIENAYGGDGGDVLIGNAADNYLAGGRGDDLLQVSAGTDVLDGGQGTDTARIGLAFGAVTAFFNDLAQLVLSAASSVLQFTTSFLGIELFQFSDRTLTLAELEVQAGQAPGGGTQPPAPDPEPAPEPEPEPEPADPPKPPEGPQEFTLTGSQGDDLLAGGADSDSIGALDGHDSVLAKGGDDTIDGGSGDDTVIAGDGADLLLGGAGNDSLNGGNHNDSLSGGSGSDRMSGGAGEDTLSGGADEDQIFGAAGQDVLHGGGHSDKLYGGSGHDTLNGDEGDDYLYGGGENDLLQGQDGFDRLFGGAGDDALYGGNGTDRLFGAAGNDTLDGGAQNDVLSGGAGQDSLSGGEGDDNLQGNDGDDILAGGSGDDTLNGGNGADTFVLSLGSSDRIVDFDLSEGDRLLVSMAPDATGEFGFVVSGGRTELRYDDGSSSALMATLAGTRLSAEEQNQLMEAIFDYI